MKLPWGKSQFRPASVFTSCAESNPAEEEGMQQHGGFQSWLKCSCSSSPINYFLNAPYSCPLPPYGYKCMCRFIP